jgi:carboxypeptidase Taq
MNEKMSRFKELFAEVTDLTNASSLLSWDQNTYMPAGGTEARGNQLATLGKIAHIKFTSDEVGKLLGSLRTDPDGLDSDEVAMVRVATRDYEKLTRVPPDFVAEVAIATTQAHEAWIQARTKSDYSVFLPHLQKIVELTHKYVSFFPPAEHPYDTLLNDYEPGMKTAEVKAIFGALRPKQVDLIKRIAAAKQVNNRFLFGKFLEKKQWDFGVDVITHFGYDWTRGRQDKSPHPFTTSFSRDDVRITTRFLENYLGSAIFSTMHECGHALYDMGFDPSYERTPLGGATSLAVHESQSRMWENLVGRSLPFWEFFYPKLKKKFPALEGVSLRNFYRGINRVEPSLIRVEADEATYNLHIMLRLELEIAMVEGTVTAKDLPDMWNAKMEDYLGLTPPNDADGVLQDIHWSMGALGYFSTYALGNLISVQFWEKIQKDIPGLDDQTRQGKFDALLGWLRENVHKYGRKYDPQDLVQRITGSKITAEPYVRYLTTKYSDIYGL